MLKVWNVVVLFFALHLTYFVSFSQTDFDNFLKHELYSTSRSIVNGTPWTNSLLYRGHPFCGSNNWKTGDVIFNGERYPDLEINYNIVEDELILFDNKKGLVKLNKRLIEEFTYIDESESTTKSFIHKELVLGDGKEFFEKVYSGTVTFYIKHKKWIKKNIGAGYMGTLYSNNKLYIVDAAGVHLFRKKGGLLDILGSSKELNKYIRKENLKINKKHPEDIVTLLMHFENLSQAN
ncbi:MAG: hypothetical protein HQ522_10425 [Bacteroidetes bacterium]|nr:hypothetical protein [Bacteroidota bacterium]